MCVWAKESHLGENQSGDKGGDENRIRDSSLEDFSPFCRIDKFCSISSLTTPVPIGGQHIRRKCSSQKWEGIVVKSFDIFLPLCVYVCVCLYTLIFINTVRK